MQILSLSLSSPFSQVDAEAIRTVMSKIGFELTYPASTKPKSSYFGNTTVADSTNGASNRTAKKSSVVKNVGRDDLWEMLDEGELQDYKFNSVANNADLSNQLCPIASFSSCFRGKLVE